MNVEEAFLETAKKIFQSIQDGRLDLNAAESGVQHKPSQPGRNNLTGDAASAKPDNCACQFNFNQHTTTEQTRPINNTLLMDKTETEIKREPKKLGQFQKSSSTIQSTYSCNPGENTFCTVSKKLHFFLISERTNFKILQCPKCILKLIYEFVRVEKLKQLKWFSN